MMGTDGLRPIVESLDREMSRFVARSGDADVAGLLASWAALVDYLALGPPPELQLTIFMGSCQRCGRCFGPPTPLDALKLTGYRVDDVEGGRWVFRSCARAPDAGSRDVEIEL